MTFQEARIVGSELLDGLPESFHLVVTVVGKMLNAGEQHHGGRVLDVQSISVHFGGAAAANDASHSSVAAIVHRGVQAALVNQPLLAGILLNLAGVGALVVDLERAISFFPDIYNDDWFFLLGDKEIQSVGVTGSGRQYPSGGGR